jgi:autotransporter-associated beta strand protein
MPGKKNLGSIIKSASQSAAKGAQKTLTAISNSAAVHGNKDLVDAANALNNVVTASQIDTKLVPYRKTSDALVESILSLSKKIKENAGAATKLSEAFSTEAQKFDQALEELRKAQADVKALLENNELQAKRAVITSNTSLLAELNPIVDTNDQEKNPLHIRAVISGATQNCKVDGKLNEEFAIKIVIAANAKLQKLETDAKTALEVSNSTLATLKADISFAETILRKIRTEIEAGLLKIKEEKEKADLANEKAKEEMAIRKANIEKERAALAKRMADLNAEEASMNTQNIPATNYIGADNPTKLTSGYIGREPGSGTIIFSGINTYSGGTTIAAGTLTSSAASTPSTLSVSQVGNANAASAHPLNTDDEPSATATATAKQITSTKF